ncbi:4Fe-4S dicluster domain-containing protein [Thermosulfurimonas sp. F29]|uniref:4Fe-4S dicluster domain-containing protein n=1 Tax=Thermosulfurimonas sp. F29 TaxID=2867247 RepID=UPI001C82E607|nr:4Fe-4S dicluster domain-containing protein [Thermosulfurimonas sp. F29]MBX6422176.1 4Fe-4S dicluster domain-containing protein [Thermosulfurimonas sp. F29]
MKHQWAMVIDLDRCVGCHACAVACRAEWQVPVNPDYDGYSFIGDYDQWLGVVSAEGGDYRRNWVLRLGPERTSKGEIAFTFFPGLCNHCDHPVCVDVCPVEPEKRTFKCYKTGKTVTMEIKATYKEPFTGAVLIDKERCIGCGNCVEACPYRARYLNDTLDEPKADKCTFCYERVTRGELPACVKTCIADARIFGDLSDPNSEVAKLVRSGKARRLESDKVKIGPNVYFMGKEKNLELLFKHFAPRKRTWEDVEVRARTRRGLIKMALRKLPTLG